MAANKNCNCSVYNFPHRSGSGPCETPTLISMAKDYSLEIDLETAAGYLDTIGVNNDPEYAIDYLLQDFFC